MTENVNYEDQIDVSEDLANLVYDSDQDGSLGSEVFDTDEYEKEIEKGLGLLKDCYATSPERSLGLPTEVVRFALGSGNGVKYLSVIVLGGHVFIHFRQFDTEDGRLIITKSSIFLSTQTFDRLTMKREAITSVVDLHEEHAHKGVYNEGDKARFRINDYVCPEAGRVTPLETKIFVTSTVFKKKVYVHIRHFISSLLGPIPTCVGVSLEVGEWTKFVELLPDVRKYIDRAETIAALEDRRDEMTALLYLQRGQSEVEERGYNRSRRFRTQAAKASRRLSFSE